MNEELLSGGLVTSGDPSYNQPGELSAAVNGFYRHDDDGLWRYPGIAGSRTIASATGHAINGIVDCRFDTVHKLIAQCNGKYWVANAEDNTSAFASALSVTEGTSLQALEHSGRWFVLNGTDTNRAFTSAGTFRNMGLLPVTAAPTLAGVTAVPFTASATGYCDYWYTELVPIEGSETLESSFSADPLTVFISAVNQAPIVQLPGTPRNASATAYRVYRTPVAETTSTTFPVGMQVSDITITGSPVTVGDAVDLHTTSTIYPGTVEVYGPSSYISASGSASGLAITFTGPAGITATTGMCMAVLSNFDFGTTPSTLADDYQYIVEYTLDNTTASPSIIGGGAADGSEIGMLAGRLRSGATGMVLAEICASATVNGSTIYGKVFGNPYYASATGAFVSAFAPGPTLYGTLGFISRSATRLSATGIEVAPFRTSCGATATASGSVNISTPLNHAFWTDWLDGYRIDSGNTGTIFNGNSGLTYYAYAAASEWWISSAFASAIGDPFYIADHRIGMTSYLSDGSVRVDTAVPSTRRLDSNFAVVIFFHPRWSATGNPTYDHATLKNIKLKVRYIGPPISSGDAYPIIQYEVGDVVASVPSHMPPPKSTTGTVFQGMAIVNDTSRPRTLCASLGENPEYFNTYYELELPTRTNDEISRIETVNDVLVIGTKGSIWKASYFPTELDAQTNRGRVMRQLSDSHNIVNVACAALFTGASGIQELAFVSTNGVFATDGTSIRDLLRDLRWSGPDGVVGTISSSTYSKCVGLVNDPSTQTLRLFINPGDGTSQVYVANYAQRHAKQGSGLKWAGPAYVSYFAGGTRTPISCAYSYRTNNGLTVVLHGRSGTGSGCGTIAVEDGEEVTTYHNLPDASHNLLSFTTRDFYPAGKGRQVELKEAWLYGHYYTTTTNATRAPGGTFDVTQHYVNAADDTSVSDSVSSRAGTRLASLPIGSVNCDGFSISWTAELANMHALYSLVLDIDDGGDTKRA